MPTQPSKPKRLTGSIQLGSASKDYAFHSSSDHQAPSSVLDDASRRDPVEAYEPPNALDGHTLPFPFETQTRHKRAVSIASTVASRTLAPRHFSGGTCVDEEGAQKNAEQGDIEKAEKKRKNAWRQRSKHYFGNDTRNLFSPTVEFIAVSQIHRTRNPWLTCYS